MNFTISTTQGMRYEDIFIKLLDSYIRSSDKGWGNCSVNKVLAAQAPGRGLAERHIPAVLHQEAETGAAGRLASQPGQSLSSSSVRLCLRNLRWKMTEDRDRPLTVMCANINAHTAHTHPTYKSSSSQNH